MLATILLVLVPILNATENIALRQMRSLHDYTTTAYLSFATAIISGTFVFSMGDSLSFVNDFKGTDWSFTLILGIGGAISAIFKFKAL